MSRIAFYTFGILQEPFGHELVQPFFDNIPTVFETAENAEGFIDRDRRDNVWGGRISLDFHDVEKYPGAPRDNPNEIAPETLSLWTDLESVSAFAYRGAHGEVFRKRREWFVKAEWPTYVAWWVNDDHVPTYAEAIERHKRLHERGPTPHAFNFSTPFDKDGKPTQLSMRKT